MLNNSFGKTIASRAADDRQSGARNIGTLNGSKKFRGTVGVGDKADFYSFTLSGRSSFKLSLNKLKNNVDVFLQQGKQVIARSTKGGKKPEVISTTLEAGTYYVRVNQKSCRVPDYFSFCIGLNFVMLGARKVTASGFREIVVQV